MAWANVSVFAFGSLLVGVPILLHLLMKQRPRHQIFPALRFLHRRQVANKRQMRLRNWLLLLMRMAAVALLAALFARPTVDSVAMGYWLRAILLGVLAPLAIVVFLYCLIQGKSKLLLGSTGVVSLLLCAALAYFALQAFSASNTGSLGDADDPVAAVLVFDTSPRMGLRHQNFNRLEQARTIARELMKQLPADSEVAVIDGGSSGAFSVDLGSAVTLVDSLQVLGIEYPLSDLVQRGIALVSSRNDKRKEVYVFSDLSENVWQPSDYAPIRKQLADEEDISLFVLDVGVAAPRNVRLGALRLSTDSLAKGQLLRIESEVLSLNVDAEVDVQVSLEEPDPTRPVMVDNKLLVPELTPRKREKLSLSAGSETPLSFTLNSLPVGVHHGQVAVSANDGLSIDDTRYFTIKVWPPYPVLLATSEGADPQPVKQAISPDEFERIGKTAFDCHIVEATQILGQQLQDYSVIGLLDPSPLPNEHWKNLNRYVQEGGSLAVFLGRNALPVAEFNQATAALLPGKLKRHWVTRVGDYLFISPKSTAHPILELFRDQGSSMPWDASPIFRHWVFEPKTGTNVIATYSNSQPAIIESTVGNGRIVVMTTPVSDQKSNTERPAWNHFPTSDEPLPFFLLMRGLFPYLARQSQHSWNHRVGQVVAVSTDDTKTVSPGDETWRLVTPQGDWQNVRSTDGEVAITSTESAGVYRLKPDDPSELGIGFSVNLPKQATDIRRLEPKLLNKILGADRYTLARGTTELNRGIGRARVGRELFPFLMLVVVGLLAMEHLLSNRFYSMQPLPTAEKQLQTAA